MLCLVTRRTGDRLIFLVFATKLAKLCVFEREEPSIAMSLPKAPSCAHLKGRGRRASVFSSSGSLKSLHLLGPLLTDRSALKTEDLRSQRDYAPKLLKLSINASRSTDPFTVTDRPMSGD